MGQRDAEQDLEKYPDHDRNCDHGEGDLEYATHRTPEDFSRLPATTTPSRLIPRTAGTANRRRRCRRLDLRPTLGRSGEKSARRAYPEI